MAKLYFRYAAMNAGKSTQLLQIEHNYAALQRRVLLLTSHVDDRFGEGRITSRLGLSRVAEVYSADTDMYERIRRFGDEGRETLGAILIDEAQFLTQEQVIQIHRGVHQLNVPVLCFGLRSDFRGMPFPGSMMLLTLAESIEEIKNVCACGSKATMNMRCDQDGNRLREGPQVLVGDANYQQKCARCFYAN
jgi:thymidine kinase